MNIKPFAALVLCMLIPLRSSDGACGGSCGSHPTVRIKFHASSTASVDASGTIQLTMTVNGKTVSSPVPPVPGQGMVATPEGTTEITPQTKVSGTLKLTMTGNTNISNGASATGYFEVEDGCGYTFQLRRKPLGSSDATYSEWEEAYACTVVTFDTSNDDFQVRLVKKADSANNNGDTDGEANTGGGGGSGSGSGSGSSSPPSIPVQSQGIPPQTTGGQPVQVTQPAFNWSEELGANSASGGFNCGSISLNGFIMPSLADWKNLEFADPGMRGVAVVTLGDGASPPTDHVRQIHLYDPLLARTTPPTDPALLALQNEALAASNLGTLIDITPYNGDYNNGGGIAVRFYRQGGNSYPFGPVGNAPGTPDHGIHPINPGAIPFRTIFLLPILAALDHQGGIRVIASSTNGVYHTTEYLAISSESWRVINVVDGQNLVSTEYVTQFDYNSAAGWWERSDGTEVSRDGFLFSKTWKTSAYLLSNANGNLEATEFALIEKTFDTATTSLTTSWVRDPNHFGRAKSLMRSDGSWESYTYYTGINNDGLPAWRGKLKSICKPWNGLPAGPADNPSSSNSECTTITYDAAPMTSGPGMGLRPLKRTTTLPISGVPAVARKQERTIGAGILSNLLDLLESGNGGLKNTWRPEPYQIMATGLKEHASDSQHITSTTFSYFQSVVAGSPWVGHSFGHLDSEGNGSVTGYESGTQNVDNNFVANSPNADLGDQQNWGRDVRSVTVKVAGFGAPALFEATREIIIRNRYGMPYLKEFSIRDGAGVWQPATTTTYEYPAYWSAGIPKEVIVRKDGRIISHQLAATIGTNTKITNFDEEGIETITVYDALNRVKSVNTVGEGTQPDIVTTYLPLGRRTEAVTVAGSLSTTQINVEDLRGRTVSEIPSSGIETTTTYPPNGLETLTTFAGGLTRKVLKNIDGRTVSVTGDGVIDENFGYAVSAVGITTTRAFGDASAEAPHVTLTTVDWAGRPIKIATPSPSYLRTRVYGYVPNTRALSSDTELGKAPKLFNRPNPASSLVQFGYDMGGTVGLVGASADRVTETKTSYISTEGRWWEVSTRKVYDEVNSSASAVTSTTTSCLFGFHAGYAAVSTTLSPLGHSKRFVTVIDRTSKTLVKTEFDGSSNSAIDVSVNGLLQSRAGHDHTNPTRWVYDALGRPTKETSPRGAIERKSYYPANDQNGNPNGALASTTDHSGKTTNYRYYGSSHQSAGKLWITTNPLQKTTSYVYSPLGQVKEVAGTANYKVNYDYDPYGAMNKMYTWRNATTSDTTEWIYEEGSGLLLFKVDAAGQRTGYTYNALGKVLIRTWARTPTVTTTYGYNTYGDIESINYSDNTPDVTFTLHDRLGRPRSIAQVGIGTEALSYHLGKGTLNARYYDSTSPMLPGLGIRYNYPAYPVPNTIGLSSGYDETSNSNALTPVRSIDYRYDSLRRLGTVVDGDHSHIYAYHPNSSLVSTITSAKGSSWFRESRYYDTPARLVGIRSDRMTGTALTAEISSHAYDYDELSRRNKNTFQDGSTATYAYSEPGDVEDRSEIRSVIRRSASGVDIPQLGSSYLYDGVGNRLKSNSPVLGNRNYTPDSRNRYASISTGVGRTAVGRAPASWTVKVAGVAADRIGEVYYRDLTASNSAAPVWQSVVTQHGTDPAVTNYFWYAKKPTVPLYDVDGNLTNDGRWIYTWDAENRLIQMQTTSEATAAGHIATKLKFVYDWQGRRIARHIFKVTSANLVSSHRWLYDGWNVMTEFSSTAETGGTLTRLNIFTWGLDLSGTLQGAGGVGGLLTQKTVNGAMERASYDGNGNIVAWTKNNGSAPTARREYDAFGNTLVNEGAWPSAFGFSSKMQEAETGHFYYGYRYYDPVLGRWPSRDPIGEEGGVNLYGFVYNNSNYWLDFLGREPRRNLNVNVSRDSSVPAELEGANKLLYDSNKNGLKDAISECCKLYKIGCDIDVKFNEDLKQPKNDAPGEGYGREGAGLDNYRKHSGKSGNGNLDVLLTKTSLDGGNADGLGAEGSGLILNPQSPGFTLPHEAGHCAGYDCGDQDEKHHNSDKDHIMGQKGGNKVDECYCKKISGLAK